MYSSVFFEPWVGKDYGSPGSIFQKKILVLGDSHYCEKCDTCGQRDIHPGCTQFTQNRMREYLDTGERESWMKTFSTFINSVFGTEASLKERIRFLDSVVFYNFLQVAAGDNATSANAYNYRDPKHLNAYYEMLKQVMPDIIFAWGDRVWNVLPDDWGFGDAKKGQSISIGSASFSKYLTYQFNGREIILVGVHHPCIGFPSNFYHEVFVKLGIIPFQTS